MKYQRYCSVSIHREVLSLKFHAARLLALSPARTLERLPKASTDTHDVGNHQRKNARSVSDVARLYLVIRPGTVIHVSNLLDENEAVILRSELVLHNFVNCAAHLGFLLLL